MRRLVIAAVVTFAAFFAATTVSTEPKMAEHRISVERTVTHRRIHRHTPRHRWYTFIVTAYTANDAGMNGRGITASGSHAIPWYTVAASRAWPFGTVLKTPNGQTWHVMDRGGGITARNRLDLYVGQWGTRTALDYGVRRVTVEIVRVGEGR